MANPAQLTPEMIQALLASPALSPPDPSIEPILINPPNPLRAVYIFVVAITVALATFMIVVRLYTKALIIRKTDFEDYTSLLGWAMFIVTVAGVCMANTFNAGVHQWNVTYSELFNILYWTNIVAITYGPSIFFLKLSILLQYLRILVPNRQSNMLMYLGIQFVIWSNFIYYFALIFIDIFECNPREAIWNKFLPGKCLNEEAIFKSAAILNLVSDFVILLLPIRSIWSLQMSMKRKIGVYAILSAGSIAVIASAVRCYYTWKLFQSSDLSYNLEIYGFWTLVELAVIVVVTCLPVSPRFFQTVSVKVTSVFTTANKSLISAQPGTAQSKSKKSSGGASSGMQKSWDDPYDPRKQLRSDYYPLEETDVKSSSFSKQPPPTMVSVAGDDLERGARR